MQVLVDGDLLVYRCGFAAERTEYAVSYYDAAYDEDITIWCENAKGAAAVRERLEQEGFEVETEKRKNLEPVENALYNVKSMIGTALESVQAMEEEVTIFLSGPTNYREALATLKPYKGNRDPEHKPTHGPAIKEYMAKTWPTVFSDGEEADDLLGIWQMRVFPEDPYGSVIVSVDKDLDMIPGLHYNFLKEESYYIDEDTGDYNFWKQMLTGDATDNIPGCPGIGPKKAEAALDGVEPSDRPRVVAELYVQLYKENWRDAMLENGRLLWIRQKEDELWTLPNNL